MENNSSFTPLKLPNNNLNVLTSKSKRPYIIFILFLILIISGVSGYSYIQIHSFSFVQNDHKLQASVSNSRPSSPMTSSPILLPIKKLSVNPEIKIYKANDNSFSFEYPGNWTYTEITYDSKIPSVSDKVLTTRITFNKVAPTPLPSQKPNFSSDDYAETFGISYIQVNSSMTLDRFINATMSDPSTKKLTSASPEDDVIGNLKIKIIKSISICANKQLCYIVTFKSGDKIFNFNNISVDLTQLKQVIASFKQSP